MTSSYKRLIKHLTPPLAMDAFRAMRKRDISLRGRYSSWSEAQRHSTGYDADAILKRVTEAALKVKAGEAVYERDSVLFDEIQYSYPVLVGLLHAATLNHSRLSVLDFGGALGSSYFQCRGFLSKLEELRWSIVEQESFVRRGRDFFEGGPLRFFSDLDECVRVQKPSVALFSSVLQYLEDPYSILGQLDRYALPYVIVDLVPLHVGEEDVVTVQHTSKAIYQASYPFRIFSKRKFLLSFAPSYEKLLEFDSLEFPALTSFSACYKGFLFKRKP